MLTSQQVLDEALRIVGTQKKLAQLLDASPSTVNRWLTEDERDRTRPAWTFCVQLAKVIGRSPASVLRAFGYDPAALDVEESPEELGENPDSAVNAALTRRITMSKLSNEQKMWLFHWMIPSLENMPPAPAPSLGESGGTSPPLSGSESGKKEIRPIDDTGRTGESSAKMIRAIHNADYAYPPLLSNDVIASTNSLPRIVAHLCRVSVAA